MRMMTQDDNPTDVLNKIDDFISNDDNSTGLVNSVGDIMKALDRAEGVIQGMGDGGYRNEMLGYVTVARAQTMNLLDALDSMLEI